MNGANPGRPLLIVVIASACLLSLPVAQAQENWDQSRGGASAWQAGSTTAPTAGTRAVLAGSGSGWTAGKGSFESRSQTGGVWREGAASPGVVSKSPAKSIGAGNPLFGKSPSSAHLASPPMIPRPGAPGGKPQITRSSVGQHNSPGSSAGGSAFKSGAGHTMPGPGSQFASRSRNTTTRKKAAPTSFTSPTQSKPESKSLDGSSTSDQLNGQEPTSDPFGGQEPSTPEETPH